MFAKVVVDIKSPNLQEAFIYHIPQDFIDYVFVGSRVVVPFAFQVVLGYVTELINESDYQGNIKDIMEVYSFEKELQDEQVKLAMELSQDLNARLVSTLALMMPSFLREKKRKTVYIDNYPNLHPELALLLKGKKKITIDKSLLPYMSLINQEIKKGNLSLGYEFYYYGKNKKVKAYYVLNKAVQKQKIKNEIIAFLTKNPDAYEEDIIRSLATSSEMLRKMVKEHLIAYQEKIVLPNENTQKRIINNWHFSFDQEQLLLKYQEINGKAFLLFSSDYLFLGAFFLKIIEDNLKNNKLTVFVVPNILYCEELAIFLREHSYGLNLYTYHSKNTNSDNYNSYMSIKYGRCDVIITTAMGVFLPFINVGTFFVCDEESEEYIYENYPYYHAVEVIKKRANNYNSKLVLTSPSPAINTYYSVLQNDIILLNNHQIAKTKATVIDMKEELLEENSDIFSKKLLSEINLALQEKKQTLLIVNQKAFATMIFCRQCKQVLRCPDCHIPLVLYEQKGFAKCTYCDYKTENYRHCSCGASQMISTGFGMEQVEYKIKQIFPSAKVLTFALTMQKTSEDYNFYLTSLEEGEVDIIIGTNALTKTFHYDNIKVVGLLYADSFLNLNDFRASEYTYDLIARLTTKESLIIQTYYPDHYAIRYGQINDYFHFYEEEINNRLHLSYEPFVQMNRLIISGKTKEAYHFANYYKKAIRFISSVTILGPSYDYRIKGVKLIIKHNNFSKIIKILNDAIKHFNNQALLISFERYPKGY